jgi:hypothetical protein
MGAHMQNGLSLYAGKGRKYGKRKTRHRRVFFQVVFKVAGVVLFNADTNVSH